MKATTTIITFFITITMWSQEIDSLQILKDKDWRTLQWLDKDTVFLKPIPKIDTNYTGLSRRERIQRINLNTYGERISFETNTMTYTNNASCITGSALQRITAFEFKDGKIFIAFKTLASPHKNHNWILKEREFEILKWSSMGIILR